ncbi:hypothetical protein [Allocoleopsis sp.]|uniref:hypothetical protein n=1 Tax=Allocoleopsis sp. TaxID=3088169 RepID=UPI002FCF3812
MKLYDFVVKSIGQLRPYALPALYPTSEEVGFTVLSIIFYTFYGEYPIPLWTEYYSLVGRNKSSLVILRSLLTGGAVRRSHHGFCLQGVSADLT